MGDIAVCGAELIRPAMQTAQIAAGLPGPVLLLGDIAYQSGTDREFRECFDKAWGSLKARSRPVPGNHEYVTPGASGYYGYFGDLAGVRGKGYYSFDLGSWHIIALNSNCTIVACAENSEQLLWLRADLSLNKSKCTLAFAHFPRFSSGYDRNTDQMESLFSVLYAGGVDVLLSSHAHSYERFAPQDPTGRLDRVSGIRQFVVGTGGAALQPSGPLAPNSEIASDKTWGVLSLSLWSDRYAWRFIPVAGQPFTDEGTDRCN